MESTIGLFKTELIKPRRPWKTLGLDPGSWTHETLDPEDLRTDISWS
jgi:hypothetical protein